MPNVFIGIAFKSRFKEILEMRHRKNFSKKFLFLLSKGDRSESVNQFLDKVSLSPVDCLCKDFRKYSPSNKDFNPADLDHKEMKEKMLQKQCTLLSRKLVKFMMET